MSLTLREAVERMNAYLEAHPEHADNVVYPSSCYDPSTGLGGEELLLEMPNSSITIVDFD